MKIVGGGSGLSPSRCGFPPPGERPTASDNALPGGRMRVLRCRLEQRFKRPYMLIPDQVVQSPMLRARQHNEVFDRVVRLVEVNVMNLFGRFEGASEMLGHDKAVLVDVPVGVRHRMIPTDVAQSATLAHDCPAAPVVPLRPELCGTHLASLLRRLRLAFVRGADPGSFNISNDAAASGMAADKPQRLALHMPVLRVVPVRNRCGVPAAAFTKAGG